MSLLLDGTGKTISVHVDKSGFYSVSGAADRIHLNPVIGDMDKSFFNHLNTSTCDWDIYSTETREPTHGKEILNKLECNSRVPYVSIKYFNHSRSPSLCVRILLPEIPLINTVALFKQVLECNSLRYVISIDFSGFVKDSPVDGTPTIENFKNGDFLLSENVSFSVMRIDAVFNR
jgi:hypothetical protein